MKCTDGGVTLFRHYTGSRSKVKPSDILHNNSDSESSLVIEFVMTNPFRLFTPAKEVHVSI
jgi:hypothetical protein